MEKILNISYRLFMEKGYENTTIQDITNELGMSKGAQGMAAWRRLRSMPVRSRGMSSERSVLQTGVQQRCCRHRRQNSIVAKQHSGKAE